MQNQRKGKLGEDAACEFLIRSGYTIIERNWRFKKAEIDIIAESKDKKLIFVEVKSRSSIYFGMPEESISQYKENLILDAAGQYVYLNGFEGAVRFDIISVKIEKDQVKILNHYEDAFFPGII